MLFPPLYSWSKVYNLSLYHVILHRLKLSVKPCNYYIYCNLMILNFQNRHQVPSSPKPQFEGVNSTTTPRKQPSHLMGIIWWKIINDPRLTQLRTAVLNSFITNICESLIGSKLVQECFVCIWLSICHD